MDERINDMPAEKKSYEAPAIKRVRLVIENAVLAACHSSPNLTAKYPTPPCSVSTGCYNPPVPPPGPVFGR